MKRIYFFPVLCLLCLGAVSNAMADIIPGDANSDGMANIGDAVFLINYIFRAGSAPENQSAADVNNDCDINLGDAVMIINYVFRENPSTLSLGCVHQDIMGDCSQHDPPRDDSSYMMLEVLGNDLHILHMNAYYQCCLLYCVEYTINGFDITARETDTNELCDCYCRFDLESILFDLADGDYNVTLIGIPGDTVGIGSITVNSAYGLSEYQQSDCLNKGVTAPLVGIEYLYFGNTLTLHHDDAHFNCAAVLMVSFEQAGDTLRFYEVNISDEAALCTCDFEVTATVVGIAPGTYVAEIYAQDIYSPMVLFDRRVIELGN
jgi:hypothetical protein